MNWYIALFSKRCVLGSHKIGLLVTAVCTFRLVVKLPKQGPNVANYEIFCLLMSLKVKQDLTIMRSVANSKVFLKVPELLSIQ